MLRDGQVELHQDGGGSRGDPCHASVEQIGQPGDVPEVAAFLPSDAARCVTGVSITVDGGSTL